MPISAHIICDSISPDGFRLTTFQLRYPKFIHGEFMTHRVFSRNASSARAVPTAKLIEEVTNDHLRAAPEAWGKNQKGMQAAEDLTGDDLQRAKHIWKQAALTAAILAEDMAYSAYAHKQIVNRILEPFIHINVVVTATEYDNFFGLRLDAGADPTMRALALAMWNARRGSTMHRKEPGQWHLPYVDQDEYDLSLPWRFGNDPLRVSVARCARVSYTSFETGRKSEIAEDLALYDRLIAATPKHLSPAEHQATPDHKLPSDPYDELVWCNTLEHGNFNGWRQFRKMIPDEARAPLPEEYIAF